METLGEYEIIKFYRHCFDNADITYDDESISLLTKYCYGIPLLMQELGENIFWHCETQNLDIQQVISGISLINNIICYKYLNKLIKNKLYASILDKIAENLS